MITAEQKEQLLESLVYLVECMHYTAEMTAQHDCHDCGGQKNGRPYLPKPGQLIRINCPLWYEKGGAK